MNSKDWRLILGIVIVFFGVLAIAQEIIFLVIGPTLEENASNAITPSLSLYIESYLGIPINLAYLFAGVVYLAKKRFAAKFVQWILVISVIYSSFCFNFFGSVIDIILLFFLFRLSKNENKNEEESSDINKGKGMFPIAVSKVLTWLSLLVFLPPLIILVMWFIASRMGKDFSETKEIYLSWLPQFLQGYGSATYFSIIMLLVAIILSAISFRHDLVHYKIIVRIIVILSCLMLLMNIWSLM